MIPAANNKPTHHNTSVMFKFLRLLSGRRGFRNGAAGLPGRHQVSRSLADTPKPDDTCKKVAVRGGQSTERLRVRRARPGDVPRVLRFVRDHAQVAWPGCRAPPAVSGVILGDYVARALAQGHSMVAEQQEVRHGWTEIRGLALAAAVSPWDAMLLEKWCQCIRCPHSRRLMSLTAHCLRAPALHDKYRVHKIMQIVLIVPPDHPKSTEIVQLLAKNSIMRGRDVGFPLLRFDVTSAALAKSLESLNLKKEWESNYNLLGCNPVENRVLIKEEEKNKDEPMMASDGLSFIAQKAGYTSPESSSNSDSGAEAGALAISKVQSSKSDISLNSSMASSVIPDTSLSTNSRVDAKENFIAVYSAFTKDIKPQGL